MMSQTLEEEKEKSRAGAVVLWGLIAFFITFASVDMYFVYQAVSTHSGIVTENAYEKGLAYNQVIEQVKIQKALNVESNITYEEGVLTVTLRDKSHAPILGATVTAKLVRSVHGGSDSQKLLHHKGNGVYQNNLDLPLKGVWTANLDVKWTQQQKQNRYQTSTIINN